MIASMDDKTNDLIKMENLVNAISALQLPERIAKGLADLGLASGDMITGPSPLTYDFGTSNVVLLSTVGWSLPSGFTTPTITFGSGRVYTPSTAEHSITGLSLRMEGSTDKLELSWGGGGDASLIVSGIIIVTKGRP